MIPIIIDKPPRKISKSYDLKYLYRKPTQVDGHKCAKVYERMLVKELGKTASVSSQ